MGGQALRVQPRHQGVPYLPRKNKQGGGEQKRRVHGDAIEASVTTDQRAGQHQGDEQHRHLQFSRCTRGPRHASRHIHYTSRIDFNNDVAYDYTIPIMQPHDQAMVEILMKIRGLTQANILAGKEIPRAPADGVDRLQSPTDDSGGQQPAAGGGSGEQGGPAGGMASNSGGAPPQHQATPAGTRSRSRATSALISTAALR